MSNPTNTLYIKGSETVDGSFRITLDDNDQIVRMEERVSGEWVLADLQFKVSSWVIDDDLGEFVLDETGEIVFEG